MRRRSFPSSTPEQTAVLARAALLGGAFDPIHNGHLELARIAVKELRLDKVLFMPSWNPPHKGNIHISQRHRLELCRLALAEEPAFSLSTAEVERHCSYTVDTLRYLQTVYPATEWTLLLGEDAFISLPYWKGAAAVCELARIAVSRREGEDAAFEAACAALRPHFAKVAVLKEKPRTVSSSQIRQLAKRQQPLDELVPADVADYITAHRLYSAEEQPT